MLRRIYLIARREYLSYVSAPGFWISLLAVPLIIAGLAFAPILIGRAEPVRAVAVLTEDPVLRAAVEGAFGSGASPGSPRIAGTRYTIVAPPAETIEAMSPFLLGEKSVTLPEGEGNLTAALKVDRTPDGGISLAVWSSSVADREPAFRAENALTELMRTEALNARGLDAPTITSINALKPKVDSFDPRRSGQEAEVTRADRAPFFVSVAMAYLLFMVIFSVANFLLSSVIEEKQAKILDSLMTSARLPEILAGKLLGVAMVSMTLLTVWGTVGGTAASLGAQGDPDGIVGAIFSAISNPTMIALFVAYFITGYLMFGAIFLGIGSLCESIQEAQTLMGPVVMILMIPMVLILVAMNTPDSAVVRAMAWVPLFAPFLGILRVPTEPPLFELIGPLILTIATVPFAIWAAAILMRAGTVDQAAGRAIRKFLSFGRMSR
jgi:ABC-2 type transport system permease protein